MIKLIGIIATVALLACDAAPLNKVKPEEAAAEFCKTHSISARGISCFANLGPDMGYNGQVYDWCAVSNGGEFTKRLRCAKVGAKEHGCWIDGL